jgi:transglutaminase-like putative cysteine protease
MVVKILSTRGAPISTSREAAAYHWRALTYDTYTARGWYSNYQETRAYAANQSLLPAMPGNMQVIEQEVSAIGDLGGMLYSAGALVRADQPYQVAPRNIPRFSPDFPVAAMNADLFSLMDIFGTRTEAKTYRATSALPLYSLAVEGQYGVETQDIASLRAAAADEDHPNEYPAWITQSYLQLPDSLPERVRRLALDLTAAQPTAYNRAAAIEAYLRAIPYTLEVGQPPNGRDVSDYYLFDLKKGYCDYAATAMVVLSRAAGVPARLVVGYAGGIYDAEKGYYVVTEADAHSWAEVFFPGVGWVEFEPTGGRAAIERPEGAIPQEIPPYKLPSLEAVPGPTLAQRLGSYARMVCIYLLGLAALTALGWALWLWVERQLWARRPAPEVIVRLYQRMAAQGERLLPSAPRGATPLELAAHLEAHLHTLGPRFAPVPAAIHRLTDLYTRTVYSPYPPSNEDRQQAIRDWSALRQALWNARMVERTHRRKTRPHR